MAPRGVAASASQRRRLNLSDLLEIAGNVQQQSAAGDDVEIVIAEHLAKELHEKLLARAMVPDDDIKQLWTHPSRNTAAFLALFFLALRRSNPFGTCDGLATSYSGIRRGLCNQFLIHPERWISAWKGFCCDVLGPALLRADTLQCYSRILAEAAEQLKPAARAAQIAQRRRDPDMQRARAAQAAPATAAGPGQSQPQGPRPQHISLSQLEVLLQESVGLVRVLSLGLLHLKDICAGLSTAGTGSSRSSSGSSGVTFPQLPPHPLRSLRDQVQSSWVLEHWEQVLLLGTEPALACGDDSRQRSALALHATFLPALRATCHMIGLDWVDVVRRPCGGVLALTHIAHLCAALDGGDLFGRPRPAVIVLPHLKVVFDIKHVAAAEDDRVATQRRVAVGLYPAGFTLRAWIEMLGEAFREAPLRPKSELQQPAAAAAAATAGRDVSSGAAEEQEGGGRGAGCAGGQVGSSAGEGPQPGAAAAAAAAEEWHAAGLATPDSLPPLNRSATIALCLRLARGVLARWGGQLPGVQLHDDASGWGSNRPLLPKGYGSALLHGALACARMALLPDVWGRQRLRGRTRAQLRAWWEAYVAAAQHPEALLVVGMEPVEYPDWAQEELDMPAQPSADAAAALAAGLLPCVTRQVTRMGAGSEGGSVWLPPHTFVGALSCWEQVLLHGPLGQVGELVSALGRRTRLAVEELRVAAAAAAAEGRRRRQPGRSVTWLLEVAHDALYASQSSVTTLCQQQAMGKYPQGVGLSDVHGGAHERTGQGAAAEEGGSGAGAGAGAAAVRDAGPSGQPEGGPAAAAGAAVGAGAGAGGRPHGQPERYAVRSSIAMAELLPALSQGVQVCAELLGRGAGRGGGRGGGQEGLNAWGEAGVDADTLMETLDCGVTCSIVTLYCASLAMAKYAAAVAGVEQQHQQFRCPAAAAAAAAPGRGCSSNSSNEGGIGQGDSGAMGSGGAAGGDGAAGGGVDGGDCPWRQLLLRDVRLMELLGAALKLHARVQAAAAARLSGVSEIQQKLQPLRQVLGHVLCLAACIFPVQFCSAIDREGGDAVQPQAQAAAAAAASRGTGGHGHGGTPPCMPLAAVVAIMKAGDITSALELVTSVLGGEVLSGADMWCVAEAYLTWCRIAWEEAPGALRVLLPPAEARAAVAAAAAAAAAGV